MNTISYRLTDELGMSFELLVDGVALSDLLADGNAGIPYWIIEDDLPYWPPHGEPRDPLYRIVTVCSCGEYGCGHSRCLVKKSDDRVILSHFVGDVGPTGIDRVFTFLRSEFDAIVSNIVRDAERQKRMHG